MEITLKFTNLEPTTAIEAYAEDKFRMLEKMLKNLDPDGAAKLHVELAHTTRHHQKGDVYEAKAKLTIPKKDFQVSEEKSDLYAAIDLAKDSLHRAIDKYKELVITKRDK